VLMLGEYCDSAEYAFVANFLSENCLLSADALVGILIH